MTDYESIKTKLDERETEELLAIWNEDKRDEWRDEAFQAIEEILTDRGIELPKQKQLIPKKKTDKTGTGLGIGTLIAYAVGEALLQEFPDSLIAKFIGRASIGGFLGTLVGFIPYFIGKKKHQGKLAKNFLIACAACGALFGVLVAAPLALVLTVIVLVRKPKPEHSTA